MKDLQREILSQVATGQITAAEGAARLDALSEEPPPEASVPAPAAVGAARSVKVIAVLGSASVAGDPTVAVAVADGPHRARLDGDTLVIEHAALDDENDTFSFGGGRRVVVNGLDIQRRSISVRMNPDLPLFASVQAGNVNVAGVHGAITADVQAGNCRLDGFRGPLHVSVQAGNVTAAGRLDAGESKIRCDMGSVKVSLTKSSSVRIAARATMGKVAVDGAGFEKSSGDAIKAVTIGAGAGTLDVDCTMGSVRVYAE
jgi:hypothetical protein